MTSSLKINNILNPSGAAVQYRGLPEGNICNVTTMTWERPIALTAFAAPAKVTY